MTTTNPVEDADRHGEEQEKYNDALMAAESALEYGFLALCKAGNAESLDAFAESHTYLDYKGGPSTADLIQIVLEVAKGEIMEQSAQVLITKMAKAYATYNVDASKLEY